MSKIVAVLLAVALAAAQSSGETPSCGSKLTACVNYLNSTTTPPPSCCNPLKEAVTNEKQCLCNIYNNPNLIQALGINITQAMNLPKLCHIDTGKSPDICKGLANSPSSSTPSGSSPPGNAAGRITGAGLVAILLMLGAFFMFY
ncbi:lipid transfer-like protein VAS [Chenopodium quinoa]|uniref:lipid transfer-like protein VAS n=1 Tax=Chenopodium quinoa TaxID=63459 RepID=UPI000B78385D|nr:lipid transfer-like protein VAS [Chenopodium quinoa]